jgi:3-methyladenine DNA glycosylase AlkC
VLVIRGDLLKKYPTAVIYAQRAKWSPEDNPNVRVLDEEGIRLRQSRTLFSKLRLNPTFGF